MQQGIVWILAILFLIATSGLWERFKRLYHVEEVVEGTQALVENRVVERLKSIEKTGEQTQALLKSQVIERVRADEFFQRSDGITETSFSTASTILISGITLGQTSSKFSFVLGQRLAAGAIIKIILVDKAADVLKQIVLRSWGQTTPEYYRKRLDNTSDLIEIIGNTSKATGTLEVGYLPFVPSFGITMVDPDLSTGAAYVEIYHHNSREPFPVFALTTNRDPYWFQFYKEQFSLMWQQCRVVQIMKDGKSPVGVLENS